MVMKHNLTYGLKPVPFKISNECEKSLMEILHTVDELRHWARTGHAAGKTIGLVPTMGALHAGHASLIRAARNSCELVAVSIFVAWRRWLRN